MNKISMLSLMISIRGSNLLRKELLLICANIGRLRFFNFKFLKIVLALKLSPCEFGIAMFEPSRDDFPGINAYEMSLSAKTSHHVR